jgi:hypothetical protein
MNTLVQCKGKYYTNVEIAYNLRIKSPIRRGFAPGFVNYKKRCTRLAAASDKVYQLFAHGRWFSPGTPASYTTNTLSSKSSGQKCSVFFRYKANCSKSKTIHGSKPVQTILYISITKGLCTLITHIDYFL